MKKLLMILVLISFCNFSNAQSNYFPLEQGDTFTYAYGSELYQGAYDNVRIKINTLSTTKIINGKEYIILEASSGSGKSYTRVSTSYVRVGKDGSILTLQDGDDQEYMTLKASPKVGDTWPSKNGKSESTARVSSLNGTIKTAK